MTLPAFLEQWARWAHRSGVWASTASGTNIFHIGVQRAREVPILVPPLAIQRRICDLIGVIEDTMAATEQLEERARVVHRSLGQELIESKGWPRARLADLLETIDGGRSPVTEGRRPVGAERGVLKLSAVKPGRFQLLETKAIGADVAMPPSAQVSVGDVLITRSNTPETVGAVCHVERVLPLTFLSDLTLRLVPGPLVSPRYLSEALNTGPARRQIIGSASGTSGSMRKISRRTIREIVIPVPPAEEQARIDEILDGASTAVDAARSQLSALGELRSAMVAGLLTGDIELADSYDELLERAS